MTNADHQHEAVTLAEVANGICLLLNEGDETSTSAAFAIAEVLRGRLVALADAMENEAKRGPAASAAGLSMEGFAHAD